MTTSVDPHPTARSNRLTELLQTNDPPLEIEERTFRDVISRSRALLNAADQKLAKMRASVDSLVLKREQLRVFIEDHEVVMHPIRRLPADVLFSIFSVCAIPMDVRDIEAQRYDSLNVRNPPWVLGQVCRRWRSVLEEMPRLWASCNVVYDSCRVTRGRRSLDNAQYLLGRHLRRAQRCPLSIGLYSSEELPRSHSLLSQLLPYSNEWKDFRVFLPTGASFQSLSYAHGLLASLETLHIGLLYRTFAPPTEPSDAFSLAPRLRELVVTGDPRISHIVTIPWAQITRYSCRTFPRIETSHHLKVLQQMDNLEECFLHCWVSAPTPPNPLRLSHLTKLHLVETMQNGIGATLILACLQAPALRHLSVEHPGGFSGTHAIIELLVLSMCPLEELKLPYTPDMTDHDLIRLLCSAPSLEKIDLASPDALTPHLFGKLTHQRATESSYYPIAPNLRSISLTWILFPWFDSKLFLDMVESRWSLEGGADFGKGPRQVVRLESIDMMWNQNTLYTSPLVLDDPRLHQFIEEGLHIGYYS